MLSMWKKYFVTVAIYLILIRLKREVRLKENQQIVERQWYKTGRDTRLATSKDITRTREKELQKNCLLESIGKGKRRRRRALSQSHVSLLRKLLLRSLILHSRSWLPISLWQFRIQLKHLHICVARSKVNRLQKKVRKYVPATYQELSNPWWVCPFYPKGWDRTPFQWDKKYISWARDIKKKGERQQVWC